MRILQVIDYEFWAIGALAKEIKNRLENHEIKILVLHPKEFRKNPIEFNRIFKKAVDSFNPQVIHFHYWDLANMLRGNEALKGRKTILTHHNQKNLLDCDWGFLDCLTCHTEKSKKILESKYWKVEKINHGVDLFKYRFFDDYDVKNNTIGYIGRIVPWKGLYEIAKVVKELGLKVVCLGRIDKGDYWKKLQEFKDVLDIRFLTPEDKKIDVIKEFGVYVGNSSDNCEEGTLGVMEAMACGIPIVSTRAGLANDILEDSKNCFIADFENYESLKEAIIKAINCNRNKLREKAWDTIKQYSIERMVYSYEKLYYSIFDGPLVSVVIPTYNKEKTILKVLDSYKNQNYKKIEILVIDDNSSDNTEEVIKNYIQENKDISIKYFNTKKEGYNLAMARNIGIWNALGDVIVFNDDGILPESGAVRFFLNSLDKKEKAVVFGNKGANKKSFVENFCMIKRKDIINIGMFNERINSYGGMSQEIRNRLKNQGFKFVYEPLANARRVSRGSSKNKKRYEILTNKINLWRLEH
jgi:glycosyltransferase involved in cell wall biosynthesis/GT2 family glycosyltransferase